MGCSGTKYCVCPTCRVLEGFGELQPIGQTLGKLAERLRRCRFDSPLYKKTWDKMQDLQDQAEEIRTKIRRRVEKLQ